MPLTPARSPRLTVQQLPYLGLLSITSPLPHQPNGARLSGALSAHETSYQPHRKCPNLNGQPATSHSFIQHRPDLTAPGQAPYPTQALLKNGVNSSTSASVMLLL